MLKNMMMLLTIFLISCQTQQYEILCDVNFNPDRCRCRCWNLATQETAEINKCEEDYLKIFGFVPNNNPTNLPLNSCQSVAGFFLGEISEDILPFIRQSIRACEDRD